MALSNEKAKEYLKRLVLSRLRILMNHGFYGLLLMHLILSVDEETETAYTDGDRIVFGTDFMDDLNDNELDFVMMHEILHVVLRHCTRGQKLNNKLYNIAADIVVNSNILKSNDMDLNSITLKKYGESMHIAPDKKEGYLYTAEEVYKMLLKKHGLKNSYSSLDDSSKNSGTGDGNNALDNNSNQGGSANGKSSSKSSSGLVDDHSKWKESTDQSEQDDLWKKRVLDAAEAISRQQDGSSGNMPVAIKRLIKDYKEPQIDWRLILNDFIQEEVCDYSFNPPDKRFDETGFYLPDYNDTDTIVSDILFMIDTSGSMGNKEIQYAFSEIKGAIDQFNGKLEGWLGFFDSSIIEPIKFTDLSSFKKIEAYGGGGTNFHCIFEYVNENMIENKPKSIIILTDGYASFPDKKMANDIPVLWLLNNKQIIISHCRYLWQV